MRVWKGRREMALWGTVLCPLLPFVRSPAVSVVLAGLLWIRQSTRVALPCRSHRRRQLRRPQLQLRRGTLRILHLESL